MSQFLPPTRLVVLVIAALALSAGHPAGALADDVPADHADEAAHAGTGEGDHADDEHASTAAGHGAEHDDRNFNLPPLVPETPLLIWSLVVFLVFLVAAKKLAWLPLIDGLDAREARVNRALAEAETARAEARKLVGEYEARMEQVTEEIKAVIAQARTDAEQEKARIIAEAETETAAMRDQAIAEIHAASNEALDSLDERIESQVTTATRHVLG